MEDLVETLTRGNVAEVEVLLASVALALGAYQLAVIAVGYGKVRASSSRERAFARAPAAGLAAGGGRDRGGRDRGRHRKFGPTSAVEREARQERLEERRDAAEERREAAQERREESRGD